MKTAFFEAKTATLLYKQYEEWVKMNPLAIVVATAGFMFNDTNGKTEMFSMIVTYKRQ